jgi:hypothetical protein
VKIFSIHITQPFEYSINVTFLVPNYYFSERKRKRKKEKLITILSVDRINGVKGGRLVFLWAMASG